MDPLDGTCHDLGGDLNTHSTSIAFLPTTPLLIPELATGAAAELGSLRAAARAAVAEVCGQARNIAVLVDGDDDRPLDSWSLRGFGLDIGEGAPQPLPVAVAGWLLDGRPARVLGTDLAAGQLHEADAVLVMGDGSTSRTDKAPGHLHPRAVAFDDGVTAAIARGDAGYLSHLDLELAREVGASGAPGWQAVAAAVQGVEHAQLLATEDRYGVLYLVATWHARWAAPEARPA